MLDKHHYTGVIVGVRRDEEPTRAKERYFSPRDKNMEWNVEDQPPELWDQFKTDFEKGTHIRIHPLLHWTELNIWEYIERENIPVIPLYFANEKGERYRSLGCAPCTFPIKSNARTVREIVEELRHTRTPGAFRPRPGQGKRRRLRETAPRRVHVSQPCQIMPNSSGSARSEQLKIVIVGHVDHGKSTFVGRLFHDTGSLPEGKLEQLQAVADRRGVPFEWANLMDALQAERDQNITIDTAQIWFRTQKRQYVIIDAPGHKEFLKNMITGAASAEAALLLIDANEGVQEQSRRHGYLLNLLGIRQMAVLVNKMDLQDYAQARFEQIEAEYRAFLKTVGVEPQLLHPHRGQARRQHRRAQPEHAVVAGADGAGNAG